MNQLATVRALQQRIADMQPLRMSDEVLPTAPPLRPLLPSGGLRKGAATTVQGSQQLALALLIEVSAGGAWCGGIGLSDFSFEAAARLGISLDRFALVPDPGPHTLGVAGMLSEVCTVIVLRTPAAPPSPHEAERLGARLREHGAALVTLGSWARNDTALQVTDSRWWGLHQGHGALEEQELFVRSRDRRGQLLHRVRFSGGRLAAPAPHHVERHSLASGH